MMRNKMMRFMIGLLSIAFIGCSGGGGDSSSTPTTSTTTPALEVLPANFDFGVVTEANSVETLEVTIQNNGRANLNVSNITLSDTVNFTLDLAGGVAPCASSTPIINPGRICTVEVDFQPQDAFLPPNGIDYSAVLTIQSNDPTSPTYEMSLRGKRQDITEINVKINQVDACPRIVGTPVTAYVSVTDQGGFPVTTLEESDFTLTEASVSQSVTTAFVNNSVNLSVVLLMDYSFSITQEPDNVTDMENAALRFVDQLGIADEAEIIKYSTTIEVTQPFTEDKTLLSSAIQSAPNLGGQTALFDAIARGVADISSRNKDRKALIIITDGEDNDGTGNPLSDNTLADVIAEANTQGVPVFTVGLGDRTDPIILQQLADDTGGTFSDSITSDNLATIYQQLANLLFTDQYALTYNTALANDETGDLEVTVTYAPGISGTDTKTISACP